jgi:glycosyltransferase involved in cell wall biosynthesis
VRPLRVLSLGFTRELWEDAASAGDDSRARLQAYAEQLESYHVIVHSLRQHALATPRTIAPRLVAHATGGRNAAHSWARMLALARRLARAERFDLVQSQDPVFTGSAGAIVSRLARVPHNVCVYGANPFDPQWVRESAWTRIAAPLGRRVLRRADGVQVDGRRTADALAAAGVPAHRIAVKPMVPRDLGLFFTATRDEALRAELTAGGRFDRLALFVGRLAPQKDVGSLLAAFQGVAAGHPAARLVIVGDGPERSALRQRAGELGLGDRALWLGSRPHPEVARVMAACDLFVLPSRYEGFARVLMEAAASALPIVTTDVSGSDEAVRAGETGLVVPVGDPSALRAALTALLGAPPRARAMGGAGRAVIRELDARHGSPRRQIEIWEALVERTAGTSGVHSK